MKRSNNVHKYFELILPYIRKYGFSHLKIDDILKYMNISKATFYKHFSSKDDLIEQLVIDYATYIVSVDPMVLDETVAFGQRFQRIYEQSVLSILIMTDEFFSDIKQYQPGLISLITSAQANRCDILQQFFTSGFKKEIFNEINPVVFFLQDDPALRRLMDPFLLNHYDTTLKQNFFDYYILKKHALFRADKLHTVDDAKMELKISQILQKHIV